MKNIASLTTFCFLAVILCIVVLHLMPVGDPHLPGYRGLQPDTLTNQPLSDRSDSIALHYNQMAAKEVGTTSVVGAIILDYRSYDTLGETIILFTTVISVLSLIGKDKENEG